VSCYKYLFAANFRVLVEIKSFNYEDIYPFQHLILHSNDLACQELFDLEKTITVTALLNIYTLLHYIFPSIFKGKLYARIEAVRVWGSGEILLLL
jgi:hypothetical protein